MGTSDAIVEVTDASFDEEIEQVDGLHMVDFWAVWCGPCRMIAPIVEDLADECDPKGLHVAKIDVDSNPSTTARFRVTSIPSVLFFKDGELIDRVVGAVPRASLEEKILEHL